jgi:hypothetical protein
VRLGIGQRIELTVVRAVGGPDPGGTRQPAGADGATGWARVDNDGLGVESMPLDEGAKNWWRRSLVKGTIRSGSGAAVRGPVPGDVGPGGRTVGWSGEVT